MLVLNLTVFRLETISLELLISLNLFTINGQFQFQSNESIEFDRHCV